MERYLKFNSGKLSMNKVLPINQEELMLSIFTVTIAAIERLFFVFRVIYNTTFYPVDNKR